MRIKSNDILSFLTGVYFLMTYIISMLTAEGSRFGGYLLIGITLLILVIYPLTNNNRLNINFTFYHVNILLFGTFCIISSLWAIRSSWAVNKGIDMLEIFVVMAVLYMVFQYDESVDRLLKILMYGSYAVVVYAFLYYGWAYMINLLLSSTRISNEAINANRLGLCAAYAIVVNIYYIVYIYNKVSFRDILIIPSLLVLVMSGSRKALIVAIAGVIGIFVMKNWDRRKIFNSLVKIVAALTALFIVLVLLSRLSILSGIEGRMLELVNIILGNDYSRSNSAWIRFEYNRLGMSLFKSNPLLGIGIGSANYYTNMYYGHDHFLHNNYIELLACGGLIGTLIYYSIYIVILYRFLKYKEYRDKEYDIVFILFLITIVMDYGMVSYLDKSTYVWLLLFWLKSQLLARKRKENFDGFKVNSSLYNR